MIVGGGGKSKGQCLPLQLENAIRSHLVSLAWCSRGEDHQERNGDKWVKTKTEKELKLSRKQNPVFRSYAKVSKHILLMIKYGFEFDCFPFIPKEMVLF